jgi:acetyl-CoA C-acetyltransferase
MDGATPVLIGAGQFTYRGDPATSPSPTALLKIAAERAAADAGIGPAGLAGLDSLAVAGFTIDAQGSTRGAIPHSPNPPASLARALGAAPKWAVYSHMGGNTSQQLVNVLAERIARGETELGLAVGAEFLGSALKRLGKGLGFADWQAAEDDDLPAPERFGDPRPGVSAYAPATAVRSPTTRSGWAGCSRRSRRSRRTIRRPGSPWRAAPRNW